MSQDKDSNIFIFSAAYLPFIGGAELAVKEITDRIPDINFFLITARLSRGLLKEEKMGNVLVYRLGFGFSFDKFLLPFLGFFKFFSLTKKLKTNNCKLLIWGLMASYGSIAAYFVKLFKPKITFLLTLQEGDSEDHLRRGRAGLVGFFGKKIIRKADRVQVISEYLKDFALSRGAKSFIDVVPNGVDIRNFSKTFSEKEKGEAKKRFGTKLNEKIVISVSRLARKNGLDILVKSLKSFNNKGILRVVLVGDGKERKYLENLSRELGVNDRLTFLGIIPNQDLPLYLAASDIFVRPSRSEGLGNSFLEAMASGIPIIGTPVGGIPDFLIDKETGLFCKIDNPEDLAEKINTLIQDKNLYLKIQENGRRLVEKKYNWDKISRKISNIFNEL